MRSRLRPLAVLALPLAPLVLAAGCGSSDDTASDAGSSPSPSAMSPSVSAPPSPSVAPSTPSAPPATHKSQPKLPDCAKVWVEGDRLPGNYRGCEKNGKKDDSLIIYCSIGNRLATYGDSYYAVPGSRIYKASPSRNKDKNWTMVHDTCTG